MQEFIVQSGNSETKCDMIVSENRECFLREINVWLRSHAGCLVHFIDFHHRYLSAVIYYTSNCGE
jgi:hypothetical protein